MILVDAGSPAERAGVMAGDVIITVSISYQFCDLFANLMLSSQTEKNTCLSEERTSNRLNARNDSNFKIHTGDTLVYGGR